VGKAVHILLSKLVGWPGHVLPTTGETEIFFPKKYPSAITSAKTQVVFWNERSKRTVENHESSSLRGFAMRDGIPPLAYALQSAVYT